MDQMKPAVKTTVVKGGESGAHPLGVGNEAAGDGIAGAVVGAISSDLFGKSAAEAINPTAEHQFWHDEYQRRPYYTQGADYEEFGPAYQYGWESFANHQGKSFKEVEPQLGRDWESRRGQSKLSWNHAQHATHDAWQRAEEAACGDSCCFKQGT